MTLSVTLSLARVLGEGGLAWISPCDCCSSPPPPVLCWSCGDVCYSCKKWSVRAHTNAAGTTNLSCLLFSSLCSRRFCINSDTHTEKYNYSMEVKVVGINWSIIRHLKGCIKDQLHSSMCFLVSQHPP